MSSVVAVVGASPNPERYSNKAIRMLVEYGHDVIPINPGHAEIEGLSVVKHLSEVSAGDVDTVTMYVQESVSHGLRDALITLAPRRVIFNPGAENAALADDLAANGIDVLEACTLVMLRTGQF